MDNEIIIQEFIEDQISQFNITDAAIAELKQSYMPLVINGLEDKIGYKAVRQARLDIKKYRVDIENKRKDLNENPIKIQKAINAEAKRVTEQLREIEDYLAKQEGDYEQELERIKKQKEEEEQLKFHERVQLLIKIGLAFDGKMWKAIYSSDNGDLVCQIDPSFIHASSDQEFNKIFVEFSRVSIESEEYKARIAKALEEEKHRQEEVKRIQAARELELLKEQQALIEQRQAELDAKQALLNASIKMEEESQAKFKEFIENKLKKDEKIIYENTQSEIEIDGLPIQKITKNEFEKIYPSVDEGFQTYNIMTEELLTPYGILLKFVKEISMPHVLQEDLENSNPPEENIGNENDVWKIGVEDGYHHRALIAREILKSIGEWNEKH